MNAPLAHVPVLGRKAQALDFITVYLTRQGRSPSINEIAAALGVGVSRAKALVHRLAQDGTIVRAPGAQRAISVPGLSHVAAIEQLRAAGWVVDEDARRADRPGAYPKGHLPIVAILEHDPSFD